MDTLKKKSRCSMFTRSSDSSNNNNDDNNRTLLCTVEFKVNPPQTYIAHCILLCKSNALKGCIPNAGRVSDRVSVR